MNDCVPNWNMDDNYRPFHTGLPTSNQKKPLRPDNENELVELVWQNGVVMHSRTNREPHGSISENPKHEILPKNGVSPENQHNLVQEDETASWFQFPLDDSLIKDLCSDLFCGTPIPESIPADKRGKDAMAGDGFEKFELVQDKNGFVNPLSRQSNRLHIEDKTMPPPNLRNSETDGLLGFSHLSKTKEVNAGLPFQREVGESSSMVSKLSGIWDSTRVLKQPDLRPSSNDASDALAKQAEDIRKKFRESGQTETHETTTVASSSGASGSSFGRTDQQTDGSQSHKRKGRDVEESGSQSEEAEYQSIQGGRRLQRPASARRSRAAKVHNLSERRRRDRINEKMKALQELIPHCSKTDKASMLDEAIEYLKSLQLQVQILWMGSGMAPMLFPNAQQYISLMGRGMGQGSMPTIPCSVQMPRLSLPNQPVTLAPPTNQIPAVTSPGNFPTRVQNSNIPDAHARFLGFNQMQPPSQVMDLFSTYRNQGSQPNQAMPLTGSGELATCGTAPSENTHSSK